MELAEFKCDVCPHKQKWISVSERKPEPYRNVLVTDGEEVWSDMYDPKAPYDYYFAGDEDVIAWMPLPEPYKEGVKQNDSE